MLKSLQKAFKVKEVRDRLLYTFMMLVVIRIGCCLPIPGVDPSYLHDFFSNLQNSGMGFFNAITGGSFSSMSIFALSITPYITSSIIMQLLTIAIPKLEEMQKDGEDGRKKIAEYTRYLTVGLALFESCAMAVGLGGKGLLLEDHRNIWGYHGRSSYDRRFRSSDVDWREDYRQWSRKRYFHRTSDQYRIWYSAGYDDII